MSSYSDIASGHGWRIVSGPTSSGQISCQNCVCWKEMMTKGLPLPKQGYCYAEPPVMVDRGVGVRPTTYYDDWCVKYFIRKGSATKENKG